MDATHDPLLSPAVSEKIKVDQHKINVLFWKELKPLQFDLAVGLLNIMQGPQDPPPPRQPERLLAILRRYAKQLFCCEEKHYPGDSSAGSWRSSLAIRIEQLVMDNVAQIEKGTKGFAYHATYEQMRTAVREALGKHIDEASKRDSSLSIPVTGVDSPPNIDTPRLPEPRPGGDGPDRFPDFGSEEKRNTAVAAYTAAWDCSDAALARTAPVNPSDLIKWKKGLLPARSEKNGRIERVLRNNEPPTPVANRPKNS